jgi:cytochrome P450
MRTVPDLAGLPVVGHLRQFAQDRLGLYRRVHDELGPIGSFRAGPIHMILTTDPALIHAILVDQDSEFEKSPALRRYLRPVVGDGILTTDQERHRAQRRAVASGFQHRRISSYADIMIDEVEQTIGRWKPGDVVDIMGEMHRMALNIVSRALFGFKVGDSDVKRLSSSLKTMLRYIDRNMTALFPLPSWLPSERRERRIFQNAIADFDRLIYEVVETRRKSEEDMGDVLSMLIRTYDDEDNLLSPRTVRDEAVTIFLAGYETTANALTWMWYVLSQNPDHYDVMVKEAKEILQGRSVAVDDLPRLEYALRCIKETMRLYPPAHSVARQPKSEMMLGDYKIPRSAVVGVSQYVVQRLPENYSEPERFDPDRFLPEHEESRPRNIYMPFSDGARNCIGAHFAMMEAHIVAVMMAQRVRFQLMPGQNIKPVPVITLRPSGPVMMRVE